MHGVAVCVLGLAGCAANVTPRVLTAQEAATSATLMIGDAAPPAAVKRWVRGEAVQAFEPGTVYVLDFWATWCGPCLASMPELSALQDRYAGKVVVIGVTRLDSDNTMGDVERTVRQRGRAVRFRIAVDEGATTEGYPVAVRDSALPRSFVIDQQGRFAWYGHPSELAGVVDAVVAGTWDVAAARKEQVERDAAAVRSRALAKEYIEAGNRQDVEGELRAAEETTRMPVKYVTGMSPRYWAWPVRVDCLARLGRRDEARDVARVAAGTAGVMDEPEAMGRLAAVIKGVSMEDATEYANRAMRLVEEAEARTPRNEWEEYLANAERLGYGWVRVTCADIYVAGGRLEEARALLRSAIAVWPDDRRLLPNKKELERRLAEYEAR